MSHEISMNILIKSPNVWLSSTNIRNPHHTIHILIISPKSPICSHICLMFCHEYAMFSPDFSEVKCFWVRCPPWPLSCPKPSEPSWRGRMSTLNHGIFQFFWWKNHGKFGQIDDFWKRDECSHVWRRQSRGKRWTIDERMWVFACFCVKKQWFVTLVADGLSVVPKICCRWLVLKSIWLSIIEGFFYDEDLEGSFFGVTRVPYSPWVPVKTGATSDFGHCQMDSLRFCPCGFFRKWFVPMFFIFNLLGSVYIPLTSL